MNKINIKKWNSEIKSFFNINLGATTIRKNKIINLFLNKNLNRIHGLKIQIINLIGNKIHSADEIYNIILSCVIDSVNNYIKQNISYKFEAFFWTDLKFKTLTKLNKFANSQQKFEYKISNSQVNLKNLKSKITLANSEVFLDSQISQKLEKIRPTLTENETRFLTLYKQNKAHLYYSGFMQNRLISQLKAKLESS
ncbi:hypothetical protein ABC565_00845 [Mycoplasmopsis synoviae]|uniref:Uncharacterized protein n=1 Tax=Mycoplasmopsis synoviae (strain 53) TaxID=262723 RepID=Q4A650_MYCS5|nr:hypothetical protein [Mycoplasmopsis synoviae]AAZ43771.1 hypothetical protein MS53_0359 [Mycoplasmopsis synoviae 53]AKB11097.1 hypothetical protein VY93_01950 [Mycoplasmopsis synoviae ATCC 25204]AKJ20580.1 hypothetical protein MSHv_01030 [Mycoplasmopsis synoviae]AQU47900.1 hypothetical protein ADF19_01030 [Mycoplasmopsis synoviae]AWL84147.1 hypothetical protein MSH_01815 [Mycoplasmopsis synoviae]